MQTAVLRSLLSYVPSVYEEALAVTSLVKPYLARALLGWVPRKASVVDGLELYYNAWKYS